MIGAAAGLLLGAAAVLASPLPSPRPLPPAVQAVATTIMAPSILPPPRPSLQPEQASAGVPPTLLPRPRPALPRAALVPLAPLPSADEMVCRDPRLAGVQRQDLIDVGDLACGIDDPVRVTSIAGIRLSQPALLGCPTARRLADWLTGIVRPEALEHLQTNVAEVWVMGSYACRTRNNVAGGRLSEHARGRAIDIGGFTLTNGRKITVARDWGHNPAGDFLRRAWRKGCGPFATVLGPEADRHHHDHLHLDTSPRGGEPHCR